MSDRQGPPRPLRERRVDLILVVVFISFSFTSLLFDRVSALTPSLGESQDPLAGPLIQFAREVDPLLLQRSLTFQVMSWISAFVFGPFYLLMAWAIWRAKAWIRLPALLYAGAMLYSTIVHLTVELLGDTPPLNMPIFLATYIPYAAAPALLIWRMQRPDTRTD